MTHFLATVDHRPLVHSMACEIWRSVGDCLEQAANPLQAIALFDRQSSWVREEVGVRPGVVSLGNSVGQGTWRGFRIPLAMQADPRLPGVKQRQWIRVVLEKEILDRVGQPTVAPTSSRHRVACRACLMVSRPTFPIDQGCECHASVKIISPRQNHKFGAMAKFPLRNPGPDRNYSAPRRKAHGSNAGWSSQVARQAHNLKVRGSNPLPATNESR